MKISIGFSFFSYQLSILRMRMTSELLIKTDASRMNRDRELRLPSEQMVSGAQISIRQNTSLPCMQKKTKQQD